MAVDANGNALLAGQTGQGVGGDDAYLVRFSPSGRVTDAVTWGSAGLDGARGVATAAAGTISLGAVVENPPPYSLLGASKRASRVKTALASSAIPLVDATGVISDPGGVVATPTGSTTFAGGFDAALVRLSLPAATLASGLVASEPSQDLEPSELTRSSFENGRGAESGFRTISANPASTSARMAFAMGAESNGQSFLAKVVDVSGRKVRDLFGFVRGGAGEVTWDLRSDDGAPVSSGLYLVEVEHGQRRQTGRIVVSR